MKKLFFSIFITLFLFGCKKEHREPLGDGCQSEAIFYLNPDLANMDFFPGNYWVHLDSVSLTYDSSYIANQSTDFWDSGCGKFQRILYSIQHSLSSTLLENLAVDYRGVFSGSGKIYIDFNTAESEPNLYTRTYFDSIFIYDRYYKKVEKSTVLDDPSENHNKVVYYMNTQFGLLRRDIFNSGNTLLSRKLLVRKTIVK